jgi:hypothetical protein
VKFLPFYFYDFFNISVTVKLCFVYTPRCPRPFYVTVCFASSVPYCWLLSPLLSLLIFMTIFSICFQHLVSVKLCFFLFSCCVLIEHIWLLSAQKVKHLFCILLQEKLTTIIKVPLRRCSQDMKHI